MTSPPLATPDRHDPVRRWVTVVTVLAAAIISITVLAIPGGTGAQSSSAHRLENTTGAYENGWSTRTGGNQVAAAWRARLADTTGAYENGWSTRTGGNQVSAAWRARLPRPGNTTTPTSGRLLGSRR